MFKIIATRDLLDRGRPFFGEAWYERLEATEGVEVAFMPAYTPVISAEQLRGYDAAIVWKPKLPAEALEGNERLRLVARWGTGTDSVDLAACTANGTIVSITPDGVRRAVATANLTLLLAADASLVRKDRMVRTGAWSERLSAMGTGLSGKVLGSLGFGNIARELFALATPFGMRRLSHTPRPNPQAAAALDVEMVDLPTLLRSADFLCVNCPLTPETRGLLSGDRLAMMKPSAVLVNTARGAIVDEEALASALRSGRLRAAALDVFAQEPPDATNPLLALDNVILSPHATAWSEEMATRIGSSVAEAVLAVAGGGRPKHVKNVEALA